MLALPELFAFSVSPPRGVMAILTGRPHTCDRVLALGIA